MPLPAKLDDTFDFPTYSPAFLPLANDTLGNAGDHTDGFDQLFNPVANSYPGDTIGSDILNPIIDNLASGSGDIATDPDEPFQSDVANNFTNADANATLLTSIVNFDPTPQPITLPDESDLEDQAAAPILITLQNGSTIQQLPGNWITASADGTISWQAGEGAPDPIQLWLSVDGQPMVLFHQDRSGSDKPDWIVGGHVYYFELQSQGNPIANTTLDTRSPDAVVAPANQAAQIAQLKQYDSAGHVTVSQIVTPPPLTTPPPAAPVNPPTAPPVPAGAHTQQQQQATVAIAQANGFKATPIVSGDGNVYNYLVTLPNGNTTMYAAEDVATITSALHQAGAS